MIGMMEATWDHMMHALRSHKLQLHTMWPNKTIQFMNYQVCFDYMSIYNCKRQAFRDLRELIQSKSTAVII